MLALSNPPANRLCEMMYAREKWMFGIPFLEEFAFQSERCGGEFAISEFVFFPIYDMEEQF